MCALASSAGAQLLFRGNLFESLAAPVVCARAGSDQGRAPPGRLHEAIIATFGRADYHMHAFESGPERLGLPDPELGFTDERAVSLSELLGDIGDRLLYTCDLGDGWKHEVTLGELLDGDPETHYPVLVAAKGASPPEDCGGPWGYAELKEILADPAHDQHQEMLEWLGLDDASGFDPKTIQLSPTAPRWLRTNP